MLRSIVLGLSAAMALGSHAQVAAPATRPRRIDLLDQSVLVSPGMHSRTRAAHRQMMSQWKAPRVDAAAPVLYPTDFGADPTGKSDSSAAFSAAVAAMVARNASGHVMSDGIADLGGVVLDLAGGDYLLSAPLVIPQYVGNLRIVDGTLRASSSFPAARYVIEVGSATPRCNPPSGQGSCNENVGMSGLTIDGSHVAAGCLNVIATMGATLDSSSAIFGFNANGVLISGGHETMIEETWVAAYFWNSPKKEHNDATGIMIAGNDHFVTNTIVFSARIGVQLTGAANLLSGVHTWNDATGNGGTGIVNAESQNRFEGCYMDFTHLALLNAEQISISNGFFLGGAQIMFSAQKQGSSVFGVSIIGNVWYDTNASPLLANETMGTWTSVTDLYLAGNVLQQGQATSHSPRATLTVDASFPAGTMVVDFSDVLLFRHAPIASATVQLVGQLTGGGAPAVTLSALPNAASPLSVTVYSQQALPGLKVIVSVDQSAHSPY